MNGTGVGVGAVRVCRFNANGLGMDTEDCSMPWYHGWWFPLPLEESYTLVPFAPGRIYFGLPLSSLVLMFSVHYVLRVTFSCLSVCLWRAPPCFARSNPLVCVVYKGETFTGRVDGRTNGL